MQGGIEDRVTHHFRLGRRADDDDDLTLWRRIGIARRQLAQLAGNGFLVKLADLPDDRSIAIAERVVQGSKAFGETRSFTAGAALSAFGCGVSGLVRYIGLIGSCAMAEDARTGVVDHTGQVFGHPGLHVVDGSIVPVPIGRNPSHTIAALAERIAAEII